MKKTQSQPIVCGTDFSDNAAQAAMVADALARRQKAPLILVHSVDERAEFPQQVQARLMNDDRSRLAEHAAQLRNLGLTFQEEVLRGAPDHGVTQFAAGSSARLLVVGASGTGSRWAARWLLGNVAERIAETSPVPTLVVRATEALVAWARGERPLKVFVATDFKATSEAALRWVADWRQIGPCEITLGYVHRLPVERGEFAMFEGLGLIELTSKAREELERDLREKAHRLLGVIPTIRIESGSARVDAHLISLAAEAEADLLVIGTHQWHDLDRVWHASISRRILHDAPMSIACVPAPGETSGGAESIPKFQRVLVATDFSGRSRSAILFAYSALPRRGAACLFHAAEPGPADQKDELEAQLRALVPADSKARGVHTETRIVESGDAGKAICEAAERFGADLICIGSHGRSGLTAAVLGSVAQVVVARSGRPVLIIPPPSS